MKKIQLNIFASLFLSSILVISCSDKEKQTTDNQIKESDIKTQSDTISSDTFALDLEKSVLNWSGKKMFENEGHNGTVKISNGSVILDAAENLIGGSLKIDMNSIVCVDEASPKLVTHLKGKDFFNVKKYPSSSFVIKQVKDSTLLGDLTICEKTLPYSAEYTYSDKKIEGKLTFDRQKFGISYHSPSTFILDKIGKKLKEKVISDEIEISFEVAAK